MLQVYGYEPSNHSLYALTGSFYNPGPYSGFLAMCLPVALHEWLKGKGIWKHVALTALVLMLVVLPSGMSRSAWLAALGVNTLKGYVNDMKYVVTAEGAKSVGGFGTIGSIFPSVWDWHRFWEMTAFLSIILAFMNILPIPALDGGHVLFLLYEIIARRKPSDQFMERAQMVGMILLFGLLIWANFNDVVRFLF